MNQTGDRSIEDVITARGISEVLHFTTNRGFLGCLATGSVLPRKMLKQEQLLERILTLNAPYRTEEQDWFDKSEDWLSYVNLSISEISTNLFKYSQRWHQDEDLFWVIMSFDPVLATDEGVYFSTTNNIYPLTQRLAGSRGLAALFAPEVPRRGNWVARRFQRASNLPTCEQAEILYPGPLPLHYLRRVYVRQGEESDRIHAMLAAYRWQSVDVLVQEDKFKGAPN